MDSTSTSSRIVKDLLEKSTSDKWQMLAIFEVKLKDTNSSFTDHLSRLITFAGDISVFYGLEALFHSEATLKLVSQRILRQQVRQLSWCSMVVVVSFDPDFLVAFAEWSLKGRLLVWTTKLVVVTRLTVQQLQALLPAHWTFSMMNTVFLNIEGNADQPRY
ncbi:hypothetical protein E2C01_053663 [Portunus trituberculatus]|uniref:Uncharacterized protein n=1 Tax=Portunus trituberculatus TaxID=210409 RepID=A0A5B7GPU7_PORTR|nr:hypothetical protein [Portunus trituberculatus]